MAKRIVAGGLQQASIFRKREAIVSTAVNIFAVCEVAEGLTDFLLSVLYEYFYERIAQWSWLKGEFRGGIFNYFNGIYSEELTSASRKILEIHLRT